MYECCPIILALSSLADRSALGPALQNSEIYCNFLKNYCKFLIFLSFCEGQAARACYVQVVAGLSANLSICLKQPSSRTSLCQHAPSDVYSHEKTRHEEGWPALHAGCSLFGGVATIARGHLSNWERIMQSWKSTETQFVLALWDFPRVVSRKHINSFSIASPRLCY